MPQDSLCLKESVLKNLALVLQIQSPPTSSPHSAPQKVLFRAPGPLRCHWIWLTRNSGYEDRERATVNLGVVFLVPSMRGHLGPTVFLTKDISDKASGRHDSRSMPLSKGPALHSSVSVQYFYQFSRSLSCAFTSRILSALASDLVFVNPLFSHFWGDS